MDIDPLVRIIDLFIQQGDLEKLIAFYNSNQASKDYIDQRIDIIVNRSGYPPMKSFQDIVMAYHKRKLDEMTVVIDSAAYQDFFKSQDGHSFAISIIQSCKPIINYGFETGNLEVIKYAFLKFPFSDFATFPKAFGILLDQYRDQFDQYPRLRIYIQNILDDAEKISTKTPMYLSRGPSPIRAVEILKVYLGNPYHLFRDDRSLSKPKELLLDELRTKDLYEVFEIISSGLIS